MSAHDSRSSAALRFAHWQASAVSQRLLTPDAAAQGYTVVRIPPHSPDAFFDMARLLLARGRFEVRLPRLLESPPPCPGLADMQAAWHAWHTWTRRLAACFERVTLGKDGTLPPVPDALQGLRDVVEEPPYA
jgi:hypothetical protein